MLVGTQPQAGTLLPDMVRLTLRSYYNKYYHFENPCSFRECDASTGIGAIDTFVSKLASYVTILSLVIFNHVDFTQALQRI